VRARKQQRAELAAILSRLAPGTALREGLDHIMRARTGALLMFSDAEDLSGIINGGFPLDVEMTPDLLYELAKMDGAIVLSADGRRVRYANVQLVPDPSIPSDETGIRHRSAERAARQTGDLVIAISQRRDVITLYRGTLKYPMQDLVLVMARANQALQTLEKYAGVLRESLGNLTALEFQDLVTLHDVAVVLRRIELVLRLSDEIAFYEVELGVEGRLLRLQRLELVGDVEQQGLLVVKDYAARDVDPEEAFQRLHELDLDRSQLSDIARLLGHGAAPEGLDAFVTPRGYRTLSRVPRLPAAVIDKVVRRFGSLQRILSASPEELDQVEGVGAVRSRAIRDGLSMQQDQLYLPRRL